MKISPFILAALLSLVFATNSISQCADITGHYSFALFGGTCISYKEHSPANDFISAVTLEMEYRKSENWAFFASGMYQFTNNDLKYMYERYNSEGYVTHNPDVYFGMINLGGRFYLSNSKFNTFLNFGLSNQVLYIGKYDAILYFFPGGSALNLGKPKGTWEYKLNVFGGAGLNYKLNNKFNIDFQYNLYQNIEKNDGRFMGFTLAGGVRYVL